MTINLFSMCSKTLNHDRALDCHPGVSHGGRGINVQRPRYQCQNERDVVCHLQTEPLYNETCRDGLT